MSQTGNTIAPQPASFGGPSAPRIAASAGTGGLGAMLGRAIPWIFVGLFLLFTLAFLVAPTVVLIVQTFIGEKGFTLSYFFGLWDYQYRIAFENSLILGVASAITGLIGGFLLAYASLQPGAPSILRTIVTSFSAVAANFAGVPLAFAFISTLGSLGFVTIFLKHLGINIYGMGFSLYSLTGMTITFAYFQIPLMLIIITPAIQGLRAQWREASDGLGATSWQYWRLVGLPILTPSLLGGFLLLFGSAFSAYATPYALTDGNIALVTIDISNVLSGNVMSDPQVGAALSTGMILVMAVVLVIYSFVSRYAARWRR
ncbi:ABC transporter permease [Acidisoma silvae]|nr:ABC transporter permease subunit [Acidisoma silvae]